MIEIAKIKTDEGVQLHAWLKTAKSLDEAEKLFIEAYGYYPKDKFKMFPGVVCGPLAQNYASGDGHGSKG